MRLRSRPYPAAVTAADRVVSSPAADGQSDCGRGRQEHANCYQASQLTALTPTPGLLEDRLDIGAAVAQAGRTGHLSVPPHLLGYLHGSTITSTMLDVNIDRTAPLPLHDQVAAQIRRAIADGEAAAGERLPLARDLAAVLGVNKNTVMRALHILRDEGLLEFRRGRGISVAGTPQRGAVLSQVRSLIEFAGRQGYGPEEVIEMIRDVRRGG